MAKMESYFKIYAHNKWESINCWARTVQNLSAAHENVLRLNDAAIHLLQSWNRISKAAVLSSSLSLPRSLNLVLAIGKVQFRSIETVYGADIFIDFTQMVRVNMSIKSTWNCYPTEDFEDE